MGNSVQGQHNGDHGITFVFVFLKVLRIEPRAEQVLYHSATSAPWDCFLLNEFKMLVIRSNWTEVIHLDIQHLFIYFLRAT